MLENLHLGKVGQRDEVVLDQFLAGWIVLQVRGTPASLF
jgi:hypothetical protein